MSGLPWARAQSVADQSDRHERLVAALLDLYAGRARAHGSPLTRDQIAGLLAVDVELNAQGLEVWLDRARASRNA